MPDPYIEMRLTIVKFEDGRVVGDLSLRSEAANEYIPFEAAGDPEAWKVAIGAFDSAARAVDRHAKRTG